MLCVIVETVAAIGKSAVLYALAADCECEPQMAPRPCGGERI